MTAPRITAEELTRMRRDVVDELDALRGGDGLSRKFARIAQRLLAELDRLSAQGGEVPERVEQSMLHDPPNSYGNCMSAVFAGLLRIPIESVPHFADPSQYGEGWRKQVNAWLRPMGLAFIDGIGFSDRDWEEYGTHGLWGMSTGRSPRDPSVSHMIAMKDGIDQWDPHPSQAGLDGDKRYTAFLVALRPWEVAHSRPTPPHPDTVEVTRKAWGVAERLFEWVKTGRVSPNEEGCCMCGASRGGCENDHGYTDMAVYYWDALRKDVDAICAQAQPATSRDMGHGDREDVAKILAENPGWALPKATSVADIFNQRQAHPTTNETRG